MPKVQTYQGPDSPGHGGHGGGEGKLGAGQEDGLEKCPSRRLGFLEAPFPEVLPD